MRSTYKLAQRHGVASHVNQPPPIPFSGNSSELSIGDCSRFSSFVQKNASYPITQMSTRALPG